MQIPGAERLTILNRYPVVFQLNQSGKRAFVGDGASWFFDLSLSQPAGAQTMLLKLHEAADAGVRWEGGDLLTSEQGMREAAKQLAEVFRAARSSLAGQKA